MLKKAGTHQADSKELAATKADSVVASRRQPASDQKAALEHTPQTTANGKLTHACVCVRGITVYISSYQYYIFVIQKEKLKQRYTR